MAAVTKIKVRLQPSASRNEVTGWEGDAIRARVTAPPTHGQANRALIELLAVRLGQPKSGITIISGHSARAKLVSIEGLTLTEVRRRLAEDSVDR